MDWTKIITDLGAPASFGIIALFLLRDESRRHAAALRELMTTCESALRDNAAAISALLEHFRQQPTPNHPKGE